MGKWTFFQYYKDFLLNIFIIVTPLVLYPLTSKIENRKWLHPLSVYMLFLVPLMLTMLFPLITETSVYDFRGIPLIVGSLYGGPFTTALLFVSLIVYRLSLGELYLLNYIAALSPAFIAIQFVLRKYDLWTVRQKISSSMLLCMLLRTTVIVIYSILGGKSVPWSGIFVESLPILLLQSALTGFFVYMIEAVRKSIALQHEIVQTEKMRMVSEMAASVAHEVRNPLTAVKGFIQLLGSGGLTEEKRDFYSSICLEELERAQSIISDYLSLAREGRERIEPVQVKDELSYIVNVLGSYANYQNVEIKCGQVGPEVLILGDKSKFRQAVMNFGINAIDAMPGGGVLEFSCLAAGGKLELSIMDTGVGMTPEQIARLGTPYYSTKEKGTGLGTMVAYTIVRQLSGTIQVSSSPGNGTVCRLTFPLHPGAPPHRRS